MKTVTSQHLPAPAGHYSHGVVSAGLLFVSGQLPFDPRTQAFADGMQAQFSQAMANLESVLQAGGASFATLVNVQIFISDVAHWPVVNSVYERLMGAYKPARAIIPCGPLHHGALVEITAVAERINPSEESLS